MSEQQDVMGELEAAGVLAGVRWAYRAATNRTLEIFSEPDGHDAALLGNMRWVWLLCRDCLTWETSGSAVGRDAVALLGSELEDRFAPNQPPAGTTILPTGIA
jgi:hypothetical protein